MLDIFGLTIGIGILLIGYAVSMVIIFEFAETSMIWDVI